ncbi:uncharacterized protein LOC143178542 [Calliopsis andreniformis]|uniref:uncharacterized protein LOC143178542 n=1 Tax=Calliopsis andreniformis TaxID=337506 RepID=UPI003FCC6DD6
MSLKETREKSTGKKMKSVKEDLFKWLCKKHATNSSLDRHLLRKKALELTKMQGLNGFKCSNYWINTFLKEYGFSTDLSNHADPIFDNYRDWIDLMRSTIIKYKHTELFHVDELSMYSDIIPTKITDEQMNSEEGTCSPANRISVLIGCNSSGTTKLPLLICGPYPSRITTKDHVYCHNEDSRIDDSLFKDWLSTVNDRMSRCNQKILLFLPRNRAHALRDFPLSNVNLVYLPEDFPPHLRPLRRDVFHYVKMIFRRRYAERLGQYSMEWSLRDILEALIDAWETIPREIIICSFQRTHFRTDDYFLQIDCECWENLDTGITFKRFVTFDDDLSNKKMSSIKSNQHQEYNLRTSYSDKVLINEDNTNSTANGGEEITELMGHEPSSKANRNYRGMLSNLRNHVDQALEVETMNKYEVKCNLIGGQDEQRMSRKRPYSEVQVSTKGESGDHKSEEGIDRKKLALDSKITLSLCLSTEPVTRQTIEGYSSGVNHATESPQTVVDKALTLTTSTEADYTKKLIDSIYATKQEAKEDVTCQTESGNLHLRRGEEEQEISLNHPSTSTNEWDSSSDKLLEDILQEVVKSHQSKKPSSDNLHDLDMDNRTLLDQNLSNQQREDHSDDSKSSENKLKLDYNWSKQYETNFVFGPSSTSERATCSSQHEHIVDSRIFNMTPSTSPKE